MKDSVFTKMLFVLASSDEKVIRYFYDLNGNRDHILYEGNAKEEYSYDKNNRLKTLINRAPNGTVISTYTYTYDLAGRQDSKTDNFGTTSYSYDSLGRVELVVLVQKTF